VAALGQDLEDRARHLELALERLVRVGVAADVDRGAFVGAAVQLLAQACG
jgi:hypothetical protein